MELNDLVRPEIRAMTKPKHGGDIWQYEKILDYSSNVNPLGPPSVLMTYIAESSGKLSNYPDDSALGLRTAIADKYRVSPENVIVGAGSAELIRLFPEVFMSPGDKVLMPTPTFSEYGFACELMGAKLKFMPLPRDEDFALNADQLLDAAKGDIKAIYLCNPNNPTSKLVPKRDILRIAEQCTISGKLLFLDETLMDLCGCTSDSSCVRSIISSDNVFLIRSFTKSFAIPGLRIGYGFGSERMIESMEKGKLSWNLGTIEQTVATRLTLNDEGHVRKAVMMLSNEKQRMHQKVEQITGLRVPYPDSCFFFMNISELNMDSKQFKEAMLKHDVLVRDCSSFGPPCDKYTRFCIRTPRK